MSFEILYHPDCLKKDVRNFDASDLKRIKQSIESRLGEAPADFGKPLRHTAKGLWSLRVGDWRVIYKILGHQVLILRIGHRRNVYGF
ncbi:MAG: type II toxin-antitoxin system RelE/ParE family toxin [Deltaproteobacteria bacterium]|nr:type II toxin-antitoxin system RelE/ParE family toxin [Deltaproteobacteria bacterium]